MTDYRSYYDYMSLLALAVPGIARQADGRAIVWYDADVKGIYERTDVRYPVMEVERPSFRVIAGTGRHRKEIRAAFSLLISCAVDDLAGQDAAMSTCEALMMQAIARIQYDRWAESFTLTPIRSYENDRLYGWGCEFTIDAGISVCWNDAMGAAVLMLAVDEVEPGAASASLTLAGISYTVPASDAEPVLDILRRMAAHLMDEGIAAYVDPLRAGAGPALSVSMPGVAFFTYGLGAGEVRWAEIMKSWR